MLPPLAAAKSRHTFAIFFAAASEIWLPSNTFDAPLAPTTHSGFDTLVLGVVVVAKRGTGAGLAGGAFCGFGRAPTGGAPVEAPRTRPLHLWAQDPVPP